MHSECCTGNLESKGSVKMASNGTITVRYPSIARLIAVSADQQMDSQNWAHHIKFASRSSEVN